jgi:hypothetical protein
MSKIEPSDFWQWAFSDLLSNALRGVLAEYIVACAAGCTQRPRTEWDAYDLQTASGLKIEVKSSAYLQSWEQKRLSAIRFDIAAKKGWDAKSNRTLTESCRSADIYVFCVFAAQEKEGANPCDTDQWFFLLCPTPQINERFGIQKSIALSSLETAGIKRLNYSELKAYFTCAEKALSQQRS